MQYQGELAALGAALAWALATWIYSQFSHKFSAIQLNVVKGTLASIMMMMLLPMTLPEQWSIAPEYIWVLAISGVIGIAIGDSAYFSSLKRIGPNKTLLLESLAPPLSGVLALGFLGTALTAQSWLGVVITTAAVCFVVFQPQTSAGQGNAVTNWSGIGFGLLASVCQASGVVISHYALVAGDLPPLLAALIRLSVGVAIVLVVLRVQHPQPIRQMLTSWQGLSHRAMGALIAAIFIGTFLALWLQQIALKHANPAVAQTLIATSPLFMLVVYALKGEPLTKRSVLGTLTAVIGIAILLL